MDIIVGNVYNEHAAMVISGVISEEKRMGKVIYKPIHPFSGFRDETFKNE